MGQLSESKGIYSAPRTIKILENMFGDAVNGALGGQSEQRRSAARFVRRRGGYEVLGAKSQTVGFPRKCFGGLTLADIAPTSPRAGHNEIMPDGTSRVDAGLRPTT
jgi:hypothetical protein